MKAAFLEKFLEYYPLSLVFTVEFLVRPRAALLPLPLRCSRQR